MTQQPVRLIMGAMSPWRPRAQAAWSSLRQSERTGPEQGRREAGASQPAQRARALRSGMGSSLQGLEAPLSLALHALRGAAAIPCSGCAGGGKGCANPCSGCAGGAHRASPHLGLSRAGTRRLLRTRARTCTHNHKRAPSYCGCCRQSSSGGGGSTGRGQRGAGGRALAKGPGTLRPEPAPLSAAVSERQIRASWKPSPTL